MNWRIMIKFFRSIRQSLLSENTFSKYLFYAAGEIVLVVIGILLALQIDTWNTHKINRGKENGYLKSYQADIEKNLTELDRVLAKSARTMRATDSLLRYATKMIAIDSINTIEGLVMESFNYTLFLSQEGTINDIFGSGDLALIEDETIRKSMVNWNADLKFLKEYEDLWRGNQADCIDYLSANTNFYKLSLQRKFLDTVTMERILADVRFLNLVSNQQHMATVLNALYLEKKEGMNRLSEQISNSIR